MMNESRVLLGGFVAGLCLTLGSFVLGSVLHAQYVVAAFPEARLEQLPLSRLFWYLVSHVIVGVLLVWLYAAIRPRYGPGWATALRAAIGAWFIAITVPAWFQLLLGVAPPTVAGPTMLTVLIASALLFVASTLAGAWLYREAARPSEAGERAVGVAAVAAAVAAAAARVLPERA